ncbi:MAG: hypothetical protein JNL82_34015 [Myxococcales bacterium]|nr:hypothetical protein [Myxococcales bacterium]
MLADHVTADELREILGVSKPTFHRSYAALLCPPMSKTSFGRGVRVYYDPSARERARWVRDCRARGLSLTQIADLIAKGKAPTCTTPNDE